MIDILTGDITTVRADAIVNAANESLAGGGGVDGAIHRAGGPSIMQACRRIGRCATGSAVITTAGDLSARYVIHAVAPRYSGSDRDAALLHGAYAASLVLAEQHALNTLAFPSLGTGAYGYPVREAAAIAIAAVRSHLSGPTSLERVTFVTFSDADFGVYRAALQAVTDVSL